MPYHLASSVRFFFFFSSRRRHTRWPRDWSSDVCSSDLNNRDVQLVSLSNRDVLLVGVNNPQCGWSLGHLCDAAENALQLGALAGQHENFLLGAALVAVLSLVHCLKFLHALQTLGDSLEVGQHATQPTVDDVRHVNAGCLFSNCFRSLLLGTNEQDGTAVSNGFLDELECFIDVGQGLLQVNDVDAVTIGEDVTTHFWVPTTGLVTKVHTSVEERAHGYNCHVSLAFSFGFVQ